MSRITEVVLIAMVCLAPWAFGSVEAWAELGLYLGVAALGVLGGLANRGSMSRSYLLAAPGLALLGLAVLGLAQAAPLPSTVMRAVDPATVREFGQLLPEAGETVHGDPGPPVPLPRLTISQDPEASLDTVARLLAAWIIFQAALGSGGGAGFRRFSLAVAINATALALFATVQGLTWNGKIYWTYPSAVPAGGPFVCHSHLAAYLNIGIGLALGLVWGADGSEPRDAAVRLGFLYAAAVMAIAVVASLSRSGFLGMAAGLAVAALLHRGLGRGLRLTLLGLAVPLPALLASLGDASPYRQRLMTLLHAEPYRFRLRIWLDAADAWRAHPLLGNGLGSFAVAAARHVRGDSHEFYAHAENEWVEWLVEGGLVALGFCLLAIVGLGRAGHRALAGARSPRGRAAALGAIVGLTALAVQSLADFAAHIPGVAVLAVALGGHLCRLAFDAAPEAPAGELGSRDGSRRVPLVGVAVAFLGIALLWHGASRARSEAALDDVDVPLPGGSLPTVGLGKASREELDERRAALVQALRRRPDWAEGHLRLGKTYLALYKNDTAAMTAAHLDDAADAERLADPVRLHGVVHSAPADSPVTAGQLLEYAPVREWLVPAAREFLEARRCCPQLALAHAELSGLDFLLVGGSPSTVYAERALRLSGSDDALIRRVARLANQSGDSGLAARCWRRSLEVNPAGWGRVAAAAGKALGPDRILREVLPEGARFPLLFARRLYGRPEDEEHRRHFARAALERAPRDRGLGESERYWLQGEACAELGDRPRAAELLKAALRLEPFRSDWRAAFVGWLIGWNELDEARRQARIGLQLAPHDQEMRRAWERATTGPVAGVAGIRQ